ncbi:MAG: hypothetical protein AB7S26_25650 [Sandaracinaceae bacterium]
MSVWIHDERTPQGIGQVITLTPEVLRRESKGLLGGGLSVTVPVPALKGFYAISYRYRSLMGGDRGAGPSQFLLSWQDPDGTPRRDTWMVDVGAPSFQTLLAALDQLRPDASLLSLPVEEAHGRLGATSLAKTQSMTVVVVVLAIVVPLFCLLGGAVLWLLAQV